MAKDAYTVFNEAEELRLASRFLKAEALYRRALVLSGKNLELRLAITISLANTLRLIGSFSQSITNYKRAEQLARKLGNDQDLLDARTGLALCFRASGEHKLAITMLRKLLKEYSTARDAHGRAFCLWALGGALRVSGDIKDALETFRKSKQMFQRLGDKAGIAYCLTGLGGASRVAGRIANSKKYYKEANKILIKVGDDFGTAYSYCGLGNVLRMQGGFKESLAYFNKAALGYKKIGDIVSYAYTLWARGTARHILGKKALARRDFTEAELLFKKTNDKRGLVYCALSFAELKAGEGEIKKALRMSTLAKNKANSYGYKIEAGYAKQVLWAIKKDPAKLPLNLA
jgi:tetratricopeptide (TPR) repeat protein